MKKINFIIFLNLFILNRSFSALGILTSKNLFPKIKSFLINKISIIDSFENLDLKLEKEKKVEYIKNNDLSFFDNNIKKVIDKNKDINLVPKKNIFGKIMNYSIFNNLFEKEIDILLKPELMKAEEFRKKFGLSENNKPNEKKDFSEKKENSKINEIDNKFYTPTKNNLSEKNTPSTNTSFHKLKNKEFCNKIIKRFRKLINLHIINSANKKKAKKIDNEAEKKLYEYTEKLNNLFSNEKDLDDEIKNNIENLSIHNYEKLETLKGNLKELRKKNFTEAETLSKNFDLYLENALNKKKSMLTQSKNDKVSIVLFGENTEALVNNEKEFLF